MYTLFINEVPLISKLLDSELYSKITNDSPLVNSNIEEYTTIQYIDDSNNLITSNNHEGISEYINKRIPSQQEKPLWKKGWDM